MEKVYITGAKRTPIGCFGGSLSTVSASDLGAIAISAAIKQSRINVECIDEVIVGNVLSAGQGMGPG
ncbi:acetyl-CoA C-acyltransferase, partial [Escherichia coli]